MEKSQKLSSKIMLCIIALFALAMITVAVLFVNTDSLMRDKALEISGYNAKNITADIDSIITNTNHISASFATNSEINNSIGKYYGEKTYQKRSAILYIKNGIFNAYYLSDDIEHIAAIYNEKGEVFNFYDISYQENSLAARFEALGVNNKDRLAILWWYPLQENFLTSVKTGNPRTDNVVFGSRRIYSEFKSAYDYTHIFALPEEHIFEKYRPAAEQLDAEVYILDAQMNLISSTNEQALSNYAADDDILKMLSERTADDFIWHNRYIVSINQSEINGWLTVLISPINSLIVDLKNMYLQFGVILTICVVLCGALVFYIYKSFMRPISSVNRAMAQVHAGNLDAYVENQKGAAEAQRMVMYYNAMLQSINVNVKERLEMEHRKNELQSEIIMAQVNPHFLYNTLETIVWKSNAAGIPDIGRIAASLGHLYRLSISNGETVIPFSKELEHLHSYIIIQKSRYEDGFELIEDINLDELKEYYVLRFMLQPIVENSLLHGIHGLDKPLTIILSAEIEEDYIRITVSDNGCGISEDQLEKIKAQIDRGSMPSANGKKSAGIGMHNVKERMRLYFGIENGLIISSKVGEGTITSVMLPKLTEKDARSLNNRK